MWLTMPCRKKRRAREKQKKKKASDFQQRRPRSLGDFGLKASMTHGISMAEIITGLDSGPNHLNVKAPTGSALLISTVTVLAGGLQAPRTSVPLVAAMGGERETPGPRPWVPALLPAPEADSPSRCSLVQTGPLSLGQTAALSSTGPRLRPPVFPKRQGPAQLWALPSPKDRSTRPPCRAVTSAPLSKALPEATTASTHLPQGSPLQHSGLESSLDCLVHGVAKSRTPLSDLKEKEKSNLTHTHAPSLLPAVCFSLSFPLAARFTSILLTSICL